MASCRWPPSLVRDHIGKATATLRRGNCSIGKNLRRQWLLRNRRLFRGESFLAGRRSLRRGPCGGSWGEVAHASMAPAQNVAREQFSSECRICAKRTLVGSEVNHDGMIQSGYLRQGQAASLLEMLFPDLLCKLPMSMTVST
jgi:hypothetical protein